MVELFGKVDSVKTRDDKQITTFRIPAVSKQLAKTRANINARLKGLREFSLENIEKTDDETDVPAQSIYLVELESLAV